MSKIPKNPFVLDPEVFEKCEAFYTYSVACSLVKNCKSEVKPFSFRRDSLADKIAQEIVVTYFKKHGLINADQMLKEETQNQIKIRHEEDWIPRKLELIENKPYIKQILDFVCPELSESDMDAYENYLRRMKISIPNEPISYVGNKKSQNSGSIRSKSRSIAADDDICIANQSQYQRESDNNNSSRRRRKDDYSSRHSSHRSHGHSSSHHRHHSSSSRRREDDPYSNNSQRSRSRSHRSHHSHRHEHSRSSRHNQSNYQLPLPPQQQMPYYSSDYNSQIPQQQMQYYPQQTNSYYGQGSVPQAAQSSSYYDIAPDKASRMSARQFNQLPQYPLQPDSVSQMMYSNPQFQQQQQFNMMQNQGVPSLRSANRFNIQSEYKEDPNMFVLTDEQLERQFGKAASSFKNQTGETNVKNDNSTAEWNELENPKTSYKIDSECPFADRIQKLLNEDPNFPMPPMPEELPLEKQVERNAILDNMTKDELRKQVILMQEQQQMLLKQQNQMKSMMSTHSNSVVSVPMFIPTPRSQVQAAFDKDPLSQYSIPPSMYQPPSSYQQSPPQSPSYQSRNIQPPMSPYSQASSQRASMMNAPQDQAIIPDFPSPSSKQRDSGRGIVPNVYDPQAIKTASTTSETFDTTDSFVKKRKSLLNKNKQPKKSTPRSSAAGSQSDKMPMVKIPDNKAPPMKPAVQRQNAKKGKVESSSSYYEEEDEEEEDYSSESSSSHEQSSNLSNVPAKMPTVQISQLPRKVSSEVSEDSSSHQKKSNIPKNPSSQVSGVSHISSYYYEEEEEDEYEEEDEVEYETED